MSNHLIKKVEDCGKLAKDQFDLSGMEYLIYIRQQYNMSVRFNLFFKIACASMFAGVGLGARFGHQGQLTEEGSLLFSKAQLYNTTNCLGLMGCSLISTPSLALKIAGGSFIVGQLLFITPLFVSSIKGKQPLLSKVMPVGGGSMMIAWLSLIFA